MTGCSRERHHRYFELCVDALVSRTGQTDWRYGCLHRPLLGIGWVYGYVYVLPWQRASASDPWADLSLSSGVHHPSSLKKSIIEFYTDSATARIQAVTEYLRDFLSLGVKCLV